ncbi:MAG: hypothetical protein KGI68_12900 [Alphaproteobacteria bacterium]|nr:hypothetical protein [Alphaproteobacteria bacterium]MDE1987845.1 hypothetical protein [Alphaproteobacteria bacterium]MDE2163342.1 hypothetical protein [Alphaproteobacteria bacterium]MDE2266082.1 hypothetical protein [Alphaproteobacteria bacterium]MDE2500467.1 hypothetical protein [Alphaproteobacteria bacterium]
MNSLMACAKSIGAGVLTLLVFAGVAFVLYTSLIAPAPDKSDMYYPTAKATITAPQPPVQENVTVKGEKRPS